MKADKVIGIILIAFSAIMYYQANHLPPPLFGDVGAAFVPKIWFAILGFCGAVLTVTGIVKDRKSRVSGTDKVAEVGFQKGTIAFFTHYKYVISGFIIFFAFISLMNYIGYFVSSLLFMSVLMWILGPRTGKSLIVISLATVGITSIIYFGFVKVLKVFLPSGSLF